MWKKSVGYFLGMVSSIAITTPVLAAERIEFNYPPFGDFDIATADLEVFVNEGKISKNFAFYANRANPEQLKLARDFLRTKFPLSPTLVSQFTYSPIGEKMLQRFGELIQTQNRQNGFYALRSALILSAASPEGLSLVNILKNYSSPSIRLNFSETVKTMGQLSELLQKRDVVIAKIQQIANQEATNSQSIDFNQRPNIRKSGGFNTTKITLNLHDRSRDGQSRTVLERKYDVDVYLPQSQSATSTPYPVIVISHGLADNRNGFVYLAQHLASHGFIVAALDHPVANSKQFQQFLAGIASPPRPTELIDRPLDVKYLLDELQRLSETDSRFKNKLNLQQVGVIGHSLGGYTALALAGGTFDFAKIRQECNPNRSLNISTFLQCRALDLKPDNYSVKDDRITAIMVMNPLGSVVFGQTGMSTIPVPVMMVAGSQDIFTPAVPEQIRPFTNLPNKDKYLAVIENGTHFSAQSDLPNGENVIPVPQGLLGPDRKNVHTYMNALGVAFFQTYLSERQEYKSYLTPAYAQFISQSPLNLSLVGSGNGEAISQLLSQVYQTP
ncbi:alpha/beta hydrolase [Nostoc sp. NIES-2111]